MRTQTAMPLHNSVQKNQPLNLFKAKHMYTCDIFFSKKMFILWEFFTDMGLEISQAFVASRWLNLVQNTFHPWK